MLALQSEDLSLTGWDQLDIYLGGPRNQSLKEWAIIKNVNQAPFQYKPNEDALAHARASNALDVLLHEHLSLLLAAP
jgi:hypothetical protein